MSSDPTPGAPLLDVLKTVAAALKADGVPFALAGGFAVYARGGRESLHDVDFVVPTDAVAAARGAMETRGLDVVQPPEDWLVKVWVDGVCVDLIQRLSGVPVDDGLLRRADTLGVGAIDMPVISATDIVVSKLHSLSEHHCDLEPVVATIRSLREQLDVDVVDAACAGQPFAEAALFLCRRLGVLSVKEAAA